jgi:tetratricopeptide (TPR) repeat protein
MTSESLLKHADELRAAGKFTDACEAYEAELTRDPGNAAAQQGEVAASEKLALQERTAGRSDDALKALLQAQRYVPDNHKLLYDLGVLEDEMRLFVDADRTLAHLESLGALDSLGPEAVYAVARVKLDLGQLGPAEEKMVAYLKLRPEDASAHYGLGRVYRQGCSLTKRGWSFSDRSSCSRSRRKGITS